MMWTAENRAVLNKQSIYFICRVASVGYYNITDRKYRGADKSLARPGRKEATATEDFDVHISYL